jgi:hypothetical protein
MELSKEQIKYIDHRLENDGIKYWDIRIEMLDHVVSDVETKLELETTEYEFKEIVQNAFVALGWKENFNGGGLEKVYFQRVKDYSKKSNNGIIKEFKERFSDFKTIVVIFFFFLYLYTFRNNSQVIKYTMYFGYAFIVITILSYFFKYKVFNSARLNRSLSLATFPLSLVNCFIFFPKFFFDYEELSSSYTTAVFGISIPFLAIGLNYLFKEFKSAQKMYNKLIE